MAQVWQFWQVKCSLNEGICPKMQVGSSLSHLKMGKPMLHVVLLQAYDVARSGLAHEPANSKAWVWLGDACREAGRWQLAALSYKAALELGSGRDSDVKV
jgi:hypothetical protein